MTVLSTVRRPRGWAGEAVEELQADSYRSVNTPLLRFPLPPSWGISLYLKDESTHPTGSLKHRLSRSLFLYGLCDGLIAEGTTIVEASSGSTAVSEAYHAALIGLPFVAVMPVGTSAEKVALIERHGGRCHLVANPAQVTGTARRLAAELGGHFMDQFTYAERVVDWRADNIATSTCDQLTRERYAEPAWVVTGAGTGGTATTFGRYLRYRRYRTKLCVVDPEGSVYYDAWRGNRGATAGGSRIEGIGRPEAAPSFRPGLIDLMLRVPDAASLAAMRETGALLGRRVGGSTGTNVWGALRLVARMRARGEVGSVVTVLCDGGERYASTYYDDAWVAGQGLDLAPHRKWIGTLLG